MKYTQDTYNKFQLAYDYFNEHLFGNELPQCLIVLQRKTNAAGYYKKNSFTNSQSENIAEIGLNPDCLMKGIKETLQTLVHEMVHLLCDVRKYASRKGWHSKQWCEIMISVGLQPINNKGEDCNDGGSKMSDRVIEGGLFEEVCNNLLEEITFDITNIVELKEKKEKKTTKFVYVCPECCFDISCKLEDKKIICGDCAQEMVIEK